MAAVDVTSSLNGRGISKLETSLPSRLINDVNGSGSSQVFLTPSSTNTSQSQAKHQRFVLPDPVAFSYLEDDPSTTVLERSRQLEGYQLYVVEQWACSRMHPTFIVTTYTGDKSHSITVGVLSVPANEEVWSPRLKVYFKALVQYHARPRETLLGVLMTTNLSSFPSSLTVILLPSGDVKKHRVAFFANENLKRLGCSGRTGLTLSECSAATQAKFQQLYKTSEKITLNNAVIELVKLCQVALMLFGKLDAEYADGLLCDVTERAINDWWVGIGSDLYNVEPSDGILGPSTVAALLGTLIGARNRLHSYGAPIAKDVFEVETTKHAIAYFQKAQGMHKSRRLDRQTLDRLHRATARQASGDGWIVPRAVKSTMAELSGKGGEMVMDMVGSRDKTTIADIETIDIDRFTQLVKGERAKWLWLGKPRKRTTRDLFDHGADGDAQLVFEDDMEGGYSWQGQRKDSAANQRKPLKKTTPSFYGRNQPGSQIHGGGTDVDPLLKKTLLRRAKSRVKDVVRGKGHVHNRSKDDMSIYDGDDKSGDSFDENITSPTTSSEIRSKDYLPSIRHEEDGGDVDKNIVEAPLPRTSTFTDTPTEGSGGPSRKSSLSTENISKLHEPSKNNSVPLGTAPSGSVASNMYIESGHLTDSQDVGLLLRRTRSFSKYETDTYDIRHDDYWPRRLSFSLAADTIFPGRVLNAHGGEDLTRNSGPENDMLKAVLEAEEARGLGLAIAELSAQVGGWVDKKISRVVELNQVASQDVEQLNSWYYSRKDEYQSLQEGSQDIVADERIHLQESVKEIETLAAKLDYEINALQGKVEDVDGAVEEFERQVRYTEGRVAELIRQGDEENWWAWLGRMVTGGTAAAKLEVKE